MKVNLDHPDALGDFGKLLGGSLASGPAEIIDRTDVGHGVTVSTALTADQGWETGIVDADHEIHVVEHYPDREAAQAGHERWCETAKTAETVTDLGYGSFIEPEIRTIARS